VLLWGSMGDRCAGAPISGRKGTGTTLLENWCRLSAVSFFVGHFPKTHSDLHLYTINIKIMLSCSLNSLIPSIGAVFVIGVFSRVRDCETAQMRPQRDYRRELCTIEYMVELSLPPRG
jgi:hypothetical protein